MDVLGSSKTVQQGLELAESNVQWVNKHYDTVINWLKVIEFIFSYLSK